MKVSIVTVSYNAADLIEQTIRSVITQTYPNVEYIVIDGGSSDGTADLIRQYADRISYWVSERDKGIYDAMNKGISAATGDYILFMNAGDMFSDATVLERTVPLLGNATVIAGRWRRCYADGRKKDAAPASLEKLKTSMPICHQATFIALPYHKAHPFDTSYRFSADYDFFYNAWKSGESFKLIEPIIADFLEAQGASTDNITASVMERSRAWKNDKGIFLRLCNLRYQILRIKSVKFLKRALHKV